MHFHSWTKWETIRKGITECSGSPANDAAVKIKLSEDGSNVVEGPKVLKDGGTSFEELRSECRTCGQVKMYCVFAD